MKPLVKWSGGKAKEIQYIRQYYPDSFDLFIEPFIGGGAVYFDLNHNNNVINDIHPELINFYQEIKNGHAEKIYQLMNCYNNEEDVYYYIRDKFKPMNNTEKAFKFFYLRKTCYRGMLRYNKKGKYNVPYGWYKTYNFDILNNNLYHQLLLNTAIYNTSFIDIFNEYNSSMNFIFLDPPYDSTFTDYGYCVFDKDNHIELNTCFKETKNKCLMVIGETPFITDLYKDYIVSKFHKKYAFKIHSNRVSNEIDNYHLIIKNY